MPAELHSFQLFVVAVAFVGTSTFADEQNQLIVFDSQWIPEKAEYRNIFVVRADGTGLRQITQAGEGHALKHAMFPSWSGDHKRIVFRGYDHNRKSQRFVVKLDDNDNKPELLGESGTVSRDGELTLFEGRDESGSPAVFVKSVHGADVHQLSPLGVPASRAEWSPVGDKILFSQGRRTKPTSMW